MSCRRPGKEGGSSLVKVYERLAGVKVSGGDDSV
jgi:hypothetical protein